MWHVYILQCADRSLYVGSTTDIQRRLLEHRAGKGGAYTRARLPVRLLYAEDYGNRSDAQRREAQIKRWPREAKIQFLKERRERRGVSNAQV